MIDEAKRFQKSKKSEDIYYPDETYDDPLSDDLLLDLDETHKQVIKQNGQVFIKFSCFNCFCLLHSKGQKIFGLLIDK